jgi:hypothetical protein
MTDQDPTQVYRPPVDPTPVNPPPAAEPPAPPPVASGTAPATPPITPPASPAVSAAEATHGTVATSPVTPVGRGSRPGQSRLKWLVAAVVVLLVAGTAAGATLLLTGSSGDPSVLAWTPADSVMYGEARLDLPGNQGTELAKVMSAFPGFDDQAAFPVKLGEVMDQLVGKASDGTMSYTGDIEPWFNGQLAVSIGALPSSTNDPGAARALVLAGIKDADKAAAWAAGLVSEAGASTTSDDYRGVTITLVEPTGMAGAISGVKAGYAVVGPVLAVGDETSLKAVIDTGGKTGLPTNDQFKTANASVSGDRLGFIYYDLASTMQQLESLAGDSLGTAVPQSLIDQVPAWVAATFRAEDSAFVMDSRSPHSDMARPGAQVKLPGLLPATTIALVEGQDFGAALADLKDRLAQVDELKDVVAQLDDALGLVGGFDSVAGWMGESGIALATVDGKLTGGIVVVPTDPTAADRLFSQLKAFLQLGGSQAGLSVSEESYAGATITVIDLSGLGGLAGSMTDGSVDLPADLKISYAVTDNVVVLGYGTDFVKAVLDAPASGSLADDPRFADALQRVGATNSGLDWLDVRAIRGLVEGLSFLPADALRQYETDMKPYLEAFDYVISATVPGTPYDSGTVVLHVSGS